MTLRDLRTTLLVAATVTYGCSAAILSIGPNEGSIINQDSTRSSISQHLGQPIESIALEPGLAVWTLQPLNVSILVTPLRSPGGDRSGPAIYPHRAVVCDTFRYTGTIERKHDVGNAIGAAGYTAGISELFAVPMALHDRVRQDARHTINVWYDSSGRVVAYLWQQEGGMSGTPPNSTLKLTGARTPCHWHPYQAPAA
jgi:hypothetical protein